MPGKNNKNTERKKEVSVAVKLMTAGTAASFADLVTFPLDTAKVRLQIQGEKAKDEFKRNGVLRYKGVFGAISTIIKEEGLRSLYNGLTAGLQRQMCFASVRIGMYDTVKAFYQNQFNGENTGAWIDVLTRICAGMSTGVLAVLIAQPTDVVKIRFQAASEQGKRYKSTFEAYKTIYQSEGLQGLWKGMYPNVARNAIVNTSEIVCYDIIKDAILRNKILNDNFLCHFTSAAITGFFTTMVSSPVDVIKTRYMNSFPGQYKSAVDCAIKTAKLEGFTAFYKGFTPAFYRLVAWNIVMWVSYEELKLLW